MVDMKKYKSFHYQLYWCYKIILKLEYYYNNYQNLVLLEISLPNH